jgi:tetratricopeptide (TPR) repeat protein
MKNISILGKIKGIESIDIALTLHNVGNVYKDQGNYQKALECYMKSLLIK